MKLTLEKEDLREIIKEVAREMISAQSKDIASPIDELRNWIRADDLYSRGLFSRPTLLKLHGKGHIGKSTIGGAVFYYIPDILNLLRENHYKPEAIDKISDELKIRNLKKLKP